MRALILAAGAGSRLGPLTATLPKPMIALGGRPILESNVRLLVAAGYDEIVINLHHRPEAIRRHFGDGAAFGARIAYADEPVLLGTAGALGPLRGPFSQPSADGATFAVVYGDNRSTIDLRKMLAGHRERGAEATLALWERPDVTASGIVAFDRDGRVTRFLEKPAPAEIFSHWVSAGIVLAEPTFLNRIPATSPSDFGRDVFPAMLADGALYAYAMRPPERLWWIDTPGDYERASAELAAGEA